MVECASVDCQALGPGQIPSHMDGGFDEIGSEALAHSAFDKAEIGQIGCGLLAVIQHEKAVWPAIPEEGVDVDVRRGHEGGQFRFGLGVAVLPFVVAPHRIIEVEKIPVRRLLGVDQRTRGIPDEAGAGKARALVHSQIGDGVFDLFSGFSQTRVCGIAHVGAFGRFQKPTLVAVKIE